MRVQSPRGRRGRSRCAGSSARPRSARHAALARRGVAARLGRGSRHDSSPDSTRRGGEVTRRNVRTRTLLVLGIVAAAVATTWLSAASATAKREAATPPDAVITWNNNAVNAVRASTPTKFQTDGMVYMAFVQAAVYDAVTKIDGQYEPYHDFAFTP